MLNLIKVNVLTFFDLHKLINAKTNKEFFYAIARLLFLLLLLSFFSISIYKIIEPNIKEYKEAEILFIILGQYMAIISSVLIASNIQKIDDLLFKFKDYNLLFSLPIKKHKIFLSKLITLYIFNMIYTIVFMISPYIIYVRNSDVSIYFHIIYFITLFIIPLVPIMISTILGIIFTTISNLFKEKKIINLMLTLIMFLLMLALSYNMFSNTKETVDDVMELLDTFNKMYPLTKLYVEILIYNNIKSLILFILIPIILFIIYLLIINKFHTKIYNLINNYKTKKLLKLKFNKHSKIISLYNKELKTYTSSNMYVMNTTLGSILFTIIVFLYIFLDKDYLTSIIGNINLRYIIENYAPVLMGSFCLLNSTTASSISMEKRTINIIKSLPIKRSTLYLSKIMVNMTVSIPFIILNGTLLNYYLNPNNYIKTMMYVTPILYQLNISMLGLYLNLKYPSYEYKSDVQIIKQSIPAIFTLIIGVFMAVSPFSNMKVKIPSNFFVWIHTTRIIFYNLILFLCLLFNKSYKKDD